MLCDIIKTLPAPLNNMFGLVRDMDDVAERALVSPSAPFTALLFALFCVLVLARAAKSAWHNILVPVLVAANPKRFKHLTTDHALEGNPPFDVAVATGELSGPKSYAIRDNDAYRAAFTAPKASKSSRSAWN
mmetsp:Transcript_14452/g.47459  ORF Transcript_14452/g.47459 Transcript_14452/m.47459 type:complete len:132 (-) Transcript_14452:212-607(-)